MWLRKQSISVSYGTSVASLHSESLFCLLWLCPLFHISWSHFYFGCKQQKRSFFWLNQAFHFYWNYKIKDWFIGASCLKVLSALGALCNCAMHSGPTHTEDFFPESVWNVGPTSTLWISLSSKSACMCVFIKLSLKWILPKLIKESGNQV